MKNFKTLLTLICLLAFANIGFTQSTKMQEKAAAKVEKLNAKITSVNADAALTAEQVEKITALEIKRMEGVKELKKSDLSSENMKAKKKEINKAINKEINKQVLTKEQRQAKKTARENKKSEQ